MLQTRLQMILHLTWSSRLWTFLLRQLLGFEVQLRVQKKSQHNKQGSPSLQVEWVTTKI
jgi:hypothetical protein